MRHVVGLVFALPLFPGWRVERFVSFGVAFPLPSCQAFSFDVHDEERAVEGCRWFRAAFFGARAWVSYPQESVSCLFSSVTRGGSHGCFGTVWCAAILEDVSQQGVSGEEYRKLREAVRLRIRWCPRRLVGEFQLRESTHPIFNSLLLATVWTPPPGAVTADLPFTGQCHNIQHFVCIPTIHATLNLGCSDSSFCRSTRIIFKHQTVFFGAAVPVWDS